MSSICASLVVISVVVWAPLPTAAADIFGHRGAGQNHPDNPLPENTLPSFEDAIEQGATSVELDVQHSADGVVVVMHDEMVDRTTTGIGCVADMTAAELQQLDAALGTSLEGTGVTVPTLGEALTATDGPALIELKVHGDGECPGTDRGTLARDVVAAIRQAGVGHMVISFDADILDLVAAEDDAIYVGLVTLNPDDLGLAVDRGYDAVHLFSALIRSEEDVARYHDAGLVLNVWTENDPLRMTELAGLGIDAITTDEPGVAVEAFAPLEPESGGCGVGGVGSSLAMSLWGVGLLMAMRRRRARA